MKHEIEIPDLPDGWEPVAYRIPKAGECYFGSQGVKLALKDFENLWLVVRKKQPRRIVLDFDDFIIQIDSDKLWKIVEDNKK